MSMGPRHPLTSALGEARALSLASRSRDRDAPGLTPLGPPVPTPRPAPRRVLTVLVRTGGHPRRNPPPSRLPRREQPAAHLPAVGRRRLQRPASTLPPGL